jgi:ParB family chromosome partitioning protein
VTENVNTTGQDHTIAATTGDGGLAVIAQVQHTRVTDTVADALDAPDAPAAEFAHIDPTTLVVEANVRSDGQQSLDRAFVASVKQYGVLMPVLVVRQADGTLNVRAGQRRTLAAIEAGVGTIPARIIDATDSAADRFVQQIIENDQRAALTDADRVGAYEQMALLGLSATAIARRVHAPKKRVAAALTIAEAEQTRQIVASANLTLDQGLILAEFEDDPEVFARLTEVATTRPASLDHEAQRARDARERAVAVTAIRDALTESGVTILDQAPYYEDKKVKHLNELTDAEGTRLTAAEHGECPGHAAYIRDWGQPAAAYVCTDAKANGHRAFNHNGGSTLTGGKMTDEEKAERREVVENNRAWKSAETVRREWLKKFAARRTAPKDSPSFIAWAVADCADALGRAGAEGHAIARDLLGLTIPDSGYSAYYGARVITEAIRKSTPARAQVIAITIALAAIEKGTGTQTWRHGNAADATYLRTLAGWGYALSDVETLVLAKADERAAASAALTEQDAAEPDDLADGEVDDLDPTEYVED